jgi:hypothetical protein
LLSYPYHYLSSLYFYPLSSFGKSRKKRTHYGIIVVLLQNNDIFGGNKKQRKEIGRSPPLQKKQSKSKQGTIKQGEKGRREGTINKIKK